MNYMHMTDQEVLRLADPQTDLEVALMDVVENLQGKNDYLIDCEGEANRMEDDISTLEDESEKKEKEIERLMELLDENSIEYEL